MTRKFYPKLLCDAFYMILLPFLGQLYLKTIKFFTLPLNKVDFYKKIIPSFWDVNFWFSSSLFPFYANPQLSLASKYFSELFCHLVSLFLCLWLYIHELSCLWIILHVLMNNNFHLNQQSSLLKKCLV